VEKIIMEFKDFIANPPVNVVKYPSSFLRQNTKPIPEVTDDVRQVCKIMFDLMYKWRGIGLSAPQVGLPYQLFIINPSGSCEFPEKEMVFINPEVVDRSVRTSVYMEGCLSMPGIYAEIERPKRFMFTALNLEGVRKKHTFEGLTGHAASHEFDHLNGVLIIDRMTPKDREIALEKLNKNTLYEPILEKCLQGSVPEGLKELYKAPVRNQVPWSLFPAWARPDYVFDGAHEG
jgi:peptide deformylase